MKALRDLKAQMQALLDEKESMAGENQELTKQKAKLELNIKDLKDEEAGHKSSKVCIKHVTFLVSLLFVLNRPIIFFYLLIFD